MSLVAIDSLLTPSAKPARKPAWPCKATCLAVGLLLGAAASAPAPVSAAPAPSSFEVDPATKLRSTDAALRQLLRRQVPDWSPEVSARKLEAARLLGNLLDIQEMARLSLDRRWEALPAEQRAQFVQTLARLAQQAFLDKLASDRHSQVSYEAATVDGEEARVEAEVTVWQETGPARLRGRIEYRLARKNGRWMVYDVAVDGVSLVASYRAEFARFLASEPFEALLSRMRRKLVN